MAIEVLGYILISYDILMFTIRFNLTQLICLEILGAEMDEDNYDTLYDTTGHKTGGINGNVTENQEFQITQNPYYGDEVEVNAANNRNGNLVLNNGDVVTVQQNLYYEWSYLDSIK